jgi:hypothetical protein
MWDGDAVRAEVYHCRYLARHDQLTRLSYWVWDTGHEFETITKLDEKRTIRSLFTEFSH